MSVSRIQEWSLITNQRTKVRLRKVVRAVCLRKSRRCGSEWMQEYQKSESTSTQRAQPLCPLKTQLIIAWVLRFASSLLFCAFKAFLSITQKCRSYLGVLKEDSVSDNSCSEDAKSIAAAALAAVRNATATAAAASSRGKVEVSKGLTFCVSLTRSS